jgi:oxygen-independent coproporphyrinogen-3 oxidase
MTDLTSFYVHIPYCSSRWGYCDFITYLPSQLGNFGLGSFTDAMDREIRLAAETLGGSAGPLQTVFFGGGTPTLFGAEPLVAILNRLREVFGLVSGAEITTEANPETITPQLLDDLLAGGFTRISIGMQSADEDVLRILDRVHTPGGALRAATQAKEAGFQEVNLDLIYGTPGESTDSWKNSVQAALSVGPTHLSAYSLIVEDGTRLARRVARGELPAPDEDDLANKYLLAEDLLNSAGLHNYEISNWALPGSECRHNRVYWRDGDWWGAGPGSHSHLGGTAAGAHRWWNVKHPRSWAAELAAGESPVAGSEVIDADTVRTERWMLQLRLAEGVPEGWFSDQQRRTAGEWVDEGLAEWSDGRLLLNPKGRLLADRLTLEVLA